MSPNNDEDIAFVINWCRAINAVVHVRGTDIRPVVVITDKHGRELGGTEIKRRMELANAENPN